MNPPRPSGGSNRGGDRRPTNIPPRSIQPADDTPRTLAERFRKFDQDHPQVYATLLWLAREWRRRTGRTRVGIAALYERARWELAIQTGESPSLNNDFRAPYARKIMAEHEDLRDLFETRRSQADQWPGAPGTEGGLW